MASPTELSLDCKPQSYSLLLKSFGESLEIDQTQKLEEFLSCLEEERLKIEAFKRELPLCMQLLTNAVEVYRQQLQSYRANSKSQGPRPVLEEFIPLKNLNPETPEKSDKASWMTSAQLWSQASTGNNNIAEMKASISPMKENIDIGLDVTSPKLGLDTKQRNGGAFLPFSKERRLPDLALANSSDDKEMEDAKKVPESGRACGNGNGGGTVVIEQSKGQNGSLVDGQIVINNNNDNTSNSSAAQTHRKARRCWSPDLHRRFVQALQMLGGSQVATPKQIRELMKVDGLTNDEVKSHLQKYRLHTRRPSPSPHAAGGPAPQLVVLGSIWVPPEYATAAAAVHAGVPTLYHHHHHHHPAAAAHPPPHFCAPPPVPQEFYTAAATSPLPPSLHHNHHQLHAYKAITSSPESPDPKGTGGDRRTESVEEGKSESSSWKAGESGGESSGGERKGLASLKEEGEESNGSEITLKF